MGQNSARADRELTNKTQKNGSIGPDRGSATLLGRTPLTSDEGYPPGSVSFKLSEMSLKYAAQILPKAQITMKSFKRQKYDSNSEYITWLFETLWGKLVLSFTYEVVFFLKCCTWTKKYRVPKGHPESNAATESNSKKQTSRSLLWH